MTDEVDDAPVEDRAVTDPEVTSRAAPGAWWGRTVLALVLVIVVAVGLAVIGLASAEDDDEAERGQDAVQVARKVGTALINIQPADLDETVSQLRELTTGQFSQEFSGEPAPFAEDLRNQGINSRGSIIEAGIGDLDEDTAQVVMLAQASVRSDATGPQQRAYQMVAQLRWISGGWAVAEMEVR